MMIVVEDMTTFEAATDTAIDLRAVIAIGLLVVIVDGAAARVLHPIVAAVAPRTAVDGTMTADATMIEEDRGTTMTVIMDVVAQAMM